ncbi:hypothetical protein CLOM_g14824 [Closterium sp. NIES-68]|nr:hypothetical protein CLOM_g14824 [Closterium sp. NIES-68]
MVILGSNDGGSGGKNGTEEKAAYQWKKYGQKFLVSQNAKRFYYHCAERDVTGCPAKLIIDKVPKEPSSSKNVPIVVTSNAPPCSATSAAAVSRSAGFGGGECGGAGGVAPREANSPPLVLLGSPPPPVLADQDDAGHGHVDPSGDADAAINGLDWRDNQEFLLDALPVLERRGRTLMPRRVWCREKHNHPPPQQLQLPGTAAAAVAPPQSPPPPPSASPLLPTSVAQTRDQNAAAAAPEGSSRVVARSGSNSERAPKGTLNLGAMPPLPLPTSTGIFNFTDALHQRQLAEQKQQQQQQQQQSLQERRRVIDLMVPPPMAAAASTAPAVLASSCSSLLAQQERLAAATLSAVQIPPPPFGSFLSASTRQTETAKGACALRLGYATTTTPTPPAAAAAAAAAASSSTSATSAGPRVLLPLLTAAAADRPGRKSNESKRGPGWILTRAMPLLPPPPPPPPPLLLRPRECTFSWMPAPAAAAGARSRSTRPCSQPRSNRTLF